MLRVRRRMSGSEKERWRRCALASGVDTAGLRRDSSAGELVKLNAAVEARRGAAEAEGLPRRVGVGEAIGGVPVPDVVAIGLVEELGGLQALEVEGKIGFGEVEEGGWG